MTFLYSRISLKEIDLYSAYSIDDFFVIDEIQELVRLGKEALLEKVRKDPPSCSLVVWGDGCINYLDENGSIPKALYELGVRNIVVNLGDDAQDYLHKQFPTMTHIPTMLKDAPLVSKKGYEGYIRRLNNGQVPPYSEPLGITTQ